MKNKIALLLKSAILKRNGHTLFSERKQIVFSFICWTSVCPSVTNSLSLSIQSPLPSLSLTGFKSQWSNYARLINTQLLQDTLELMQFNVHFKHQQQQEKISYRFCGLWYLLPACQTVGTSLLVSWHGQASNA